MHCRRLAGARQGMCELTRQGERHGSAMGKAWYVWSSLNLRVECHNCSSNECLLSPSVGIEERNAVLSEIKFYKWSPRYASSIFCIFIDITVLLLLLLLLRHEVAQCLRRCDTHRKVAGSIPDCVIGIFLWYNPSGRTMTLGSTQPLTEMSTRNISWGVKAAGA
jgi:hypothetical protein